MQVEELEDFVARYSGKVLHPNHVLVVDKVYNLAKMYGRMEGYGADVLTDEQLKTKRDLCERALKVLNVIMPGKSYHTYFWLHTGLDETLVFDFSFSVYISRLGLE